MVKVVKIRPHRPGNNTNPPKKSNLSTRRTGYRTKRNRQAIDLIYLTIRRQDERNYNTEKRKILVQVATATSSIRDREGEFQWGRGVGSRGWLWRVGVGGEGGWRYSRDFREGETEGGGGGLGGKEAMKTGLFQAAFYLLGLFRSLSL
jgi:hypothetical protein